jgi:ketosteroid isomerase-like protein
VRAEIQAICAAENGALSRKDLDAAFALYASDWEILDADGSRRTLEQDREDTKEVFRVLKSFRPSTVIDRVTMRGPDAVVIDRSNGEMDMENLDTGKRAHIRYSMVSEVMWRRSGSSWLAYMTRVLSRKRWVDGKLVTDQTADRVR